MIRIYRLQDSAFTHADVVELFKESFAQWTENGLGSILLQFTPSEFAEKTANAVVLVAVDTENNVLAGTATIVIDHDKKEKYGYNKYLAVKPSYKRRGIASQLLQARIDIAKQEGCRYILSNTAVGADWSINWHKKNGFKTVGLYSVVTSDYYSYRFRYQLKSPSIWNCALFTKMVFCASYLKTRAMRTQDGGMTGFGNAVLKVFRSLKLV